MWRGAGVTNYDLDLFSGYATAATVPAIVQTRTTAYFLYQTDLPVMEELTACFSYIAGDEARLNNKGMEAIVGIHTSKVHWLLPVTAWGGRALLEDHSTLSSHPPISQNQSDISIQRRCVTHKTVTQDM